MPRLSPQTIEQVAAANDIVEVIGGHIPLRRAGSSFKALCPFHREKTPSFHVNPQRQSYHCFGCGAGGSVFRFLMQYENLDFQAAVRRLAERAGIPIIEDMDSSQNEPGSFGQQRRRLLALHAAATDWFHKNLLKKESAAHARAYLKERGFDKETAITWKLGYAPASWDALLEWGQANGFTLQELHTSGLIKSKDNYEGFSKEGAASYYSRFRDRLMFPINNELGEVIAFSGRILDPNASAETPKYVNSPETPIFTKGKVLFGIHQTKRAILDSKTAIVCEGQIDLIRIHSAGIPNVLAPQGTAFTDKQARLLKRYAEEAVLCFDADSAGQQAVERSFPALLEANVNVRVATMPPGEDPDSLIRKPGGTETFKTLLANAQDFFDFQIQRLSQRCDLKTPRGQTQFCRHMAELILLVGDPVMRETISAKVTARVGLPLEEFRRLLRSIKSPHYHAPDLRSDTANAAPRFETPPPVIDLLFVTALQDADAATWLESQSPDLIQQSQTPGVDLLVRLLNLGSAQIQSPQAFSAFTASLNSAEEAYIASKQSAPLPSEPLQVAQDCWRGLEKQTYLRKRNILQSKLRQPELDLEQVLQIQKEIVALQQQLTEVHGGKVDENLQPF